MKKGFLPVSLIIAVVCAAAALQGCGGTVQNAKASIKRGDEVIALIEKDSELLSRKLASTLSVVNDSIYSNKTPDITEFKDDAEQIVSLAGQISDKSARARSEFENVLELDDVEEYKKYAGLWIKIIDANVEGLSQLEAFLNEVKGLLAASPFDPVAIESFEISYKDSIDKKGEETAKLHKEAQDLKRQKKL